MPLQYHCIRHLLLWTLRGNRGLKLQRTNKTFQDGLGGPVEFFFLAGGKAGCSLAPVEAGVQRSFLVERTVMLRPRVLTGRPFWVWSCVLKIHCWHLGLGSVRTGVVVGKAAKGSRSWDRSWEFGKQFLWQSAVTIGRSSMAGQLRQSLLAH